MCVLQRMIKLTEGMDGAEGRIFRTRWPGKRQRRYRQRGLQGPRRDCVRVLKDQRRGQCSCVVPERLRVLAGSGARRALRPAVRTLVLTLTEMEAKGGLQAEDGCDLTWVLT